ncbi:hypothetical protein Hdeb2414_s0011g00373081 [Helianthus debilis subsp. tardiflorus]
MFLLNVLNAENKPPTLQHVQQIQNSIDQPKKICAHIFQFVLHIINHHSIRSSDYQQPIEQRICSTEDLLITTHTNDQHVISANLLIHQSSQRPGLQHRDSNDQPDVATNLFVPQSTERAVHHHQETNNQPNVAAIFEIPQSFEPAGDHHQGYSYYRHERVARRSSQFVNSSEL